MQSGLYGSFSDRDEGHEARRAVLAIRRNLDHSSNDAPGAGESSKAHLINSSASKLTATRYLCLIKNGRPYSGMQEQFFPAENNAHAVLLGIRWVRLFPAKKKDAIEEMRIMNLRMPARDRTMKGMAVYLWKHGDATPLDAEFDRVTLGLLQSQLGKLESALDQIYAMALDAKCRELEKLLSGFDVELPLG